MASQAVSTIGEIHTHTDTHWPYGGEREGGREGERLSWKPDHMCPSSHTNGMTGEASKLFNVHINRSLS